MAEKYRPCHGSRRFGNVNRRPATLASLAPPAEAGAFCCAGVCFAYFAVVWHVLEKKKKIRLLRVFDTKIPDSMTVTTASGAAVSWLVQAFIRLRLCQLWSL